MINRRQFLARLSGFPIMAAFPLPTTAAGLRRYQLTAAREEHPLGGLGKPVSPLLLYNGKSPGPKLTARKGETLEIDFQNRLDQPTTIHWHGIRNLNEMHGVISISYWFSSKNEDTPCVLLSITKVKLNPCCCFYRRY